MIKKIDLLNRFKKIHGDEYDYSLVDYKGMLKKVKIICRKHGVFEQMSSVHLSGSGCPICNSVKLDSKEFFDRCNKIHIYCIFNFWNNFYDYSISNFKGVAYKMKIICPLHGEFEQRAGNHLAGQKCPYCANQK